MKYLLISVVTIITFISQSQTFIKGRAISGIPANCDVAVTCSEMNAPLGSELQLISLDTEIPIVLNSSFSDTLNGLCESTSLITEVDAMYYLIASNGDTISSSWIYPQGIDFVISNYTAPSSAVAMDGSISFTFNSQPLAGFGTTAEIFIQNSTAIPYIISTDSLTFTVNNLHEGSLNMLVPFYGYFHSTVGYIGDYANSIVNNNLNVNLNIDDSDGGCNGFVELIPDPTATGVTYTWSEINFNGMSNVSNACPGYYRVLVEDDLGNNRLLEFVISDSNYNYVDPWSNFLDPTDTLNFSFSACNIDYNLPLDSISWTETLINSNLDTNFYQLDLTIYQDTNAIVINQTYFTTTDTMLMLACGFYCETFKSNGFSGLKVYLSRDGSQDAFVAAVKGNELNLIRIFPNPSSDYLNLEGCERADLVDLFGKKVLELHEGLNDIKKLDCGTYFINPNNQSNWLKVIIE